MTPKENPIQIKCYCGHTIYCDCGPKEEPKENDHSGDSNEMITKQTAVDLLNQWHIDNPYATPTEWRESFNKAKEIEKEQMLEFWQGGIDCTQRGGTSFEQYYNETYNK